MENLIKMGWFGVKNHIFGNISISTSNIHVPFAIHARTLRQGHLANSRSIDAAWNRLVCVFFCLKRPQKNGEM